MTYSMPDDEKAEIEALAKQVCGASVTGYGDRTIPCDRSDPHKADGVHWSDHYGVVWAGA